MQVSTWSQYNLGFVVARVDWGGVLNRVKRRGTNLIFLLFVSFNAFLCRHYHNLFLFEQRPWDLCFPIVVLRACLENKSWPLMVIATWMSQGFWELVGGSLGAPSTSIHSIWRGYTPFTHISNIIKVKPINKLMKYQTKSTWNLGQLTYLV